MYHKTVMLTDAVDALEVKPGGLYVDATYGGGGHTREILKRLQGGRVIAFDQDEDAWQNRIDDNRLTTVFNNFRFLRNFLRLHGAIPVDGIIADLGVSSYQIDMAPRGFSIRFDGPLDMRMDRRKSLTARKVLETYTEEQLAGIFRDFGEVAHPGRLAAAITAERGSQAMLTTSGLSDLVRRFAPRGKENQYLAQVFQALRIEVNHELDALCEFLQHTASVMRSGGRLVVISYHSLEDRIVKNFMRSGNTGGVITRDFYGNQETPWRVVTRKAIAAPETETAINSRSRSARLRVAEKI